MNVTPGSVKPRLQELPQIGVARFMKKGVKEGEELERPHEEGAAARRTVGVVHRHEQPSVRFIDLDDFPGPHGRLAFTDDVVDRSRKVVRRVNVPLELARFGVAKRNRSFPGPVEFYGMANVEDKERIISVFRERLHLATPQPLPPHRVTVFLPNRFSGGIKVFLLPFRKV
jgi:hypothetical protein